MIEIKKKVQIMWRDTSDYFEMKNADVINQIVRTRPLQSSKSSINAVLRNTEEMKAIMPLILGQGHSGDVDQSFTANVSNYWNSMAYRVRFPSEIWEIGMTFDAKDSDTLRKGFIAELTEELAPKPKGKKEAKETKPVNPNLALKADKGETETETEEPIKFVLTDEALAEYVLGETDGKLNVPVEYRFRYGVPINPSEFLLWQYSLNHGNVANTKSLLKNSTKMEFYLVDETIAKQERASLHKIKTEARKAYMETILKPELVIDILAVMGKDIPFDTPEDEVTMAREELLDKIVSSSPEEFMNVKKSANLTTLAKIERYIKAGVLRRLDNSNIVVDASNPEIIIGNNKDNQLAYFANASNKDQLADYNAKYKSLTNKN